MSDRPADELTALVREALVPHLDYVAASRMADAAQDVLDVLEDALVDEGADAALPALLDVTNRLLELLLHADDGSGLLGDAALRAVDVYARACRDGTPDATALARWLVSVRIESLGSPEPSLDQFAPGLGGEGLEALRAEIDALASAVDDGPTHLQRVAEELRRELAELGA
ncbi:hypothetical protein ABFU82_20770 [Nocardioides sp. WV_118_6]